MGEIGDGGTDSLSTVLTVWIEAVVLEVDIGDVVELVLDAGDCKRRLVPDIRSAWAARISMALWTIILILIICNSIWPLRFRNNNIWENGEPSK